ncbi:MAG TPA: molybdopterin-dependent oxidoreductase [Chloroflexota bacterium]|nr:molybdopterin-dependent oxidoreductase [Chloroflexota bacterium]
MEIRSSLPLHRVPAAIPSQLRVDGLVEQPLALTVADLEALPQRTVVDDFTCLEGWTVPGLVWEGVPLEALLALVQPRPEAQWVQASAGEFTMPLPLAEARGALLALRLNGQPLPKEHGGPLRLIVPGRECFTSIKWLERLELRAAPGPDTARQIARGRLAPDRPADA